MSDAWKRRILLFAFLYFVCLIFVLKIYDVSVIGPEHATVGLATINNWFRDLFNYNVQTGYSKSLFIIMQVLSAFATLVVAFWTTLFIKDWLDNKGSEGRGMDKNLMATFFIYLFTGIICFLFKVFPVNNGPVLFPERVKEFYSFPAFPIVLIIIAMGSTMYHLAEILEGKKKPLKIAFGICIAVMTLGTVITAVSGIYWLTDIIGALLLCTFQILLYSFFFFV